MKNNYEFLSQIKEERSYLPDYIKPILEQPDKKIIKNVARASPGVKGCQRACHKAFKGPTRAPRDLRGKPYTGSSEVEHTADPTGSTVLLASWYSGASPSHRV